MYVYRGIAARECCKPEPEGECRAACRRVFVGDWSAGAMSHVTTHCPAHVTACVTNQTSSHNQLSRMLRYIAFNLLVLVDYPHENTSIYVWFSSQWLTEEWVRGEGGVRTPPNGV